MGEQIRGRLEPFSLGEGTCLILALRHWPPVNLNANILLLFCSFISLIVKKLQNSEKSKEAEMSFIIPFLKQPLLSSLTSGCVVVLYQES